MDMDGLQLNYSQTQAEFGPKTSFLGFFFFFETSSHYVVQTGFEFTV